MKSDEIIKFSLPIDSIISVGLTWKSDFNPLIQNVALIAQSTNKPTSRVTRSISNIMSEYCTIYWLE